MLVGIVLKKYGYALTSDNIVFPSKVEEPVKEVLC